MVIIVAFYIIMIFLLIMQVLPIWVFIGRTDVEVETPILWPPDAKS